MLHVFESDMGRPPSVTTVQQLAAGSLTCRSDRTMHSATWHTQVATQTKANTVCNMLTSCAKRLSVSGLSRAFRLRYTFLAGPFTLYGAMETVASRTINDRSHFLTCAETLVCLN